MRTWNDWNDLEVNRKVAEVLGKKPVRQLVRFEYWVWIVEGDNGIERLPDYCNDVVHTWPIMIKHYISVDMKTPTQVWRHHDGTTSNHKYMAHCMDIYYFDKNPIRAAMIVFLMMNGVEENWE